MRIENIKPFITGATGFIGGRIAERLWLDHGIKSTCLVSSYVHAARLARLPVVMAPGDLLQPDALIETMSGCNVVFHCAVGQTADPQRNRRINEKGLRHLGEAALRHGVRRFIHFSTVAVYGPRPPEYVDETTPVCYSGDEYGDSKIRAEAICGDLQQAGLPLVIIRPSVVFGPFSPIWTIGAIKRVLSGGWEDTEDVHGLCNPVYIDDLVTALYRCIERDEAVGETFLISGGETVSWNDFYGAYKHMAHLPAAANQALPAGIAKPCRTIMAPTVRLLRRFLEPQLRQAYEQLKATRPALARKLYRLANSGLDQAEKQKLSQKTIYSIDKARRSLGYSPRTFASGMDMTERWLKHHEFIP